MNAYLYYRFFFQQPVVKSQKISTFFPQRLAQEISYDYSGFKIVKVSFDSTKIVELSILTGSELFPCFLCFIVRLVEKLTVLESKINEFSFFKYE